MNSIRQPFKFPTKLWLLLSFACFFYLSFGFDIGFGQDQPTVWRALFDGEIATAVIFFFIWLGLALAFGAFAAAALGILKQLLWKVK